MHPGAHAAETPDKPAIVMAGSGEVVTYADLEARSNQIAHLFRSLGLTTGDPVALMLENTPRLFDFCWAAQRTGLRYTAISSRLTAEEVNYILNDCGATVLLASGHTVGVAGPASQGTKVTTRLLTDGDADGFDSLDAVVGALPTTPVADEVEGADMLYSSGTTGRPKGIKVPISGDPLGTPNPLLGLVTGLFGMGPAATYLSPAPLYHAAPLRFCMAMHRVGGTVVVLEHFDPIGALKAIEDHRVTHSQWVPTMFIRMMKLPAEDRARYDLSSLQLAVHAAAPCPPAVKQQMIEWWGPVLHEYYAGTEGNGFVYCNSESWLAHPGTVGQALVGQIHILDDDGNEVPQGESGTIYFGGGSTFEYHNDPDKTAASRNAEGWSTLGDVGYVDPDGFLFLTDRKAYMIISGGVNIYPQEAENLLALHPKVADVAVFGVPDDDFGEAVKAVVQPMDGVEGSPELEAELIAYCRDHLAALKCPRTVDFRDELPRHPTGKLYKRLLKDEYWKAAGRSI